MLNCEKYAKEIAKGLAWDEYCNFTKKYILKKDNCSDMTCSECERKIVQWLLEEYKEPEIDWLKVPVDTPVLVRDDGEWLERYFVCYMPCTNFPFVAFNNGKKREKAQGTQGWLQCKLADGVDPTPFLKEV